MHKEMPNLIFNTGKDFNKQLVVWLLFYVMFSYEFRCGFLFCLFKIK